MTFQRVMNRNRLASGNYSTAPDDWFSTGTKVAWSLLAGKPIAEVIEFAKRIEADWNEAALAYNTRVCLLAGDLRRLERDAVDERAICEYIAHRTLVAPDVVAAVLKEFMTW